MHLKGSFMDTLNESPCHLAQTGGNGWFLISRLKEEIAAGMAAAGPGAAAAATAPLPPPSGGKPPTPASAAATKAGGRQRASSWWARRVSEGAFNVLSDMAEAVISTAAAQEDWRVVVAALQIADCVYCCTGTGVRRRLIASLARCPTLFAEWFWSGAFAFAVSSTYLGAENRAELQDVVAATLAEFAHLVTGVGVRGEARSALPGGPHATARASSGMALCIPRGTRA